MKKIAFYGPKDIRVEEMLEIPACEEGGLLVKVEAAAICGSDIKAYNVGNPKLTPGCTMGHEFVGRVVESRNTQAFHPGDRVTMATTIGCGTCHYCNLGKSNLCVAARAMGFAYNGAMADYVCIPGKAVDNGNVVSVPDDIPAEVAALAEPMSCVMNGLSRIPAGGISYAVIIGLGALGLFHALALREQGVANIVCCANPGVKMDLATELGFLTVTPDDLHKNYLELSAGLGFDLVVITAPSSQIQEKAPAYARKGGYVSYFASLPVADEAITISSRLLHYNELVFFGTSDSTARHVEAALRMIQTQSDSIKKVITVLPIDQVLAGIQGVMDKQYAKVVLVPDLQK